MWSCRWPPAIGTNVANVATRCPQPPTTSAPAVGAGAARFVRAVPHAPTRTAGPALHRAVPGRVRSWRCLSACALLALPPRALRPSPRPPALLRASWGRSCGAHNYARSLCANSCVVCKTQAGGRGAQARLLRQQQGQSVDQLSRKWVCCQPPCWVQAVLGACPARARCYAPACCCARKHLVMHGATWPHMGPHASYSGSRRTHWTNLRTETPGVALVDPGAPKHCLDCSFALRLLLDCS